MFINLPALTQDLQLPVRTVIFGLCLRSLVTHHDKQNNHLTAAWKSSGLNKDQTFLPAFLETQLFNLVYSRIIFSVNSAVNTTYCFFCATYFSLFCDPECASVGVCSRSSGLFFFLFVVQMLILLRLSLQPVCRCLPTCMQGCAYAQCKQVQCLPCAES